MTDPYARAKELVDASLPTFQDALLACEERLANLYTKRFTLQREIACLETMATAFRGLTEPLPLPEEISHE